MEKNPFNGEMITVVCYIDVLKVSHKNPFEVTKFTKNLSMLYEEKLKVHRIKVHDYLGVDWD